MNEFDSKHILNLGLRHTDNIIIILSADLTITKVNPAGLQTFGWKKNKVLNRKINDVFKESSIEPFINILPLFKKTKYVSYVIQNEKKFKIQWHIIPIKKDPNSTQDYTLIIGKKIIELSETSLGTISLDNILKYAPDLFYWKDKNSIYEGCNDEFAKLAGLNSRDEVKGKSDYDLAWKDRADFYIAGDTHVIKTGQAKLHHEEKIRVIGGNTITAITSKVPIFDNNNKVIGVLGITTDITYQKKIEQDLQIAKERAESANKAKTQFLANISHDIRTPLVGIQGIAEMLMNNLADNLKDEAKSIVLASGNLLDLLNDIISLAQLETGESRLQKIPFDFKNLLNEIFILFAPAAKKKELEFVCYYASDLPTRFMGNRVYLHRSILNLVSNALKFTDKGKITVSIQFDKETTNTNSNQIPLEIKVEDSGIGIPKNKQDEIFKSFTRLNPAYQGIYKGSGLGLHITKQFVEEMGGFITLDSAPGQGSNFRIHLTLDLTQIIPNEKAIEEGKYSDDLPQSAVIKQETKQNYNLPPITQTLNPKEAKAYVLLVEDNPMIQKVSTYILNDIECFVDIAPDGETALKMSAMQTYDIIFMDIGLPGLDGFAVTHHIRTEPNNPNVKTPIIALTAHMDSGSKEQCIAAGMNTVITKPLSRQQGRELLKQFLR